MKLFKRRAQEPAEIAAPLTPGQEAALEALRAEGIAIVPFASIVTDPGLWDELASDIDRWSASAPSRMRTELAAPSAKDDFLIRRYRPGKGEDASTIEAAEFAPQDPWMRFGVEGGVLDIVNAYRGRATRLVDLDHWYTVPFEASHDRVSSQRWHRDPEDRNVVKVFVYFSDVDEGAGPFQYVRGSAEGGRYGDLWPWGEDEWYPPQDEFEQKIPAEELFTATGSRGTVLLCDTSGFHRGGFAERTPRILSYHTFVSPDAEYDRKFTIRDADSEKLTDRAAFALS